MGRLIRVEQRLPDDQRVSDSSLARRRAARSPGSYYESMFELIMISLDFAANIADDSAELALLMFRSTYGGTFAANTRKSRRHLPTELRVVDEEPPYRPFPFFPSVARF